MTSGRTDDGRPLVPGNGGFRRIAAVSWPSVDPLYACLGIQDVAAVQRPASRVLAFHVKHFDPNA